MLNIRTAALVFRVSRSHTWHPKKNPLRTVVATADGLRSKWKCFGTVACCRRVSRSAGKYTRDRFNVTVDNAATAHLLHNHHALFSLVRQNSIVEYFWCFDPSEIRTPVILDVRSPPEKAERIRRNRSHAISESRGPHKKRPERQYPYCYVSRA